MPWQPERYQIYKKRKWLLQVRYTFWYISVPFSANNSMEKYLVLANALLQLLLFKNAEINIFQLIVCQERVWFSLLFISVLW